MNFKCALLTVAASAFFLTGCGHYPDMNTGRAAYKAGDYETAALHYQELSDFGMPRAKIELGKLYLYGRGVERDPAKALELFREAEALGEADRAATYIPRAQAKLGARALENENSKLSDAEAFAMLKTAAEAGNRTALFEMGQAYEKGLGVPKNGRLADQYYAQSAAKGYGRADFYRGRIYQRGDLVAKDVGKAIALYKKAGQNDYPRAYIELGDMYAQGNGVALNKQAAKEYYLMAQSQGEQVDKELENLQKGL